MSIQITTQVLSNAVSWEQYYELLMSNESMADLRHHADYLLQNINIESKLYNLMSNLTQNLTWLVVVNNEDKDAIDFLILIHIIASCSDRVDVRVYTDISLGESAAPRAVLICFQTGNLQEIDSWEPPRDLWNQPEADKIIAVQEKLIDLVKIWNE